MKDLMIKLNSFFNRVLRYFISSSIISILACFCMFFGNLVAGLQVSFGFYFMIFAILDIVLASMLCIFNSHKLFVPTNKKLIKKVEREEVERAREFNRRKFRKSKVS